mgnify:FL=1
MGTEQNAVQLQQIQQLIQQYQQLNNTQGFQSFTGTGSGQTTGIQSVLQPGFAGTDAEKVRQKNNLLKIKTAAIHSAK